LNNFNSEELKLIIGHSLGCQLAVKFLEEKNISNSKIILVAPTYPNLAKEL
jgi:predicted alpha/beta hydrolase family esterase